jgi:hypothetical protein
VAPEVLLELEFEFEEGGDSLVMTLASDEVGEGPIMERKAERRAPIIPSSGNSTCK